MVARLGTVTCTISMCWRTCLSASTIIYDHQISFSPLPNTVSKISVNMFKFARDVAYRCPDREKRTMLRERCDEAKEAFDRFNLTAATVDMEILVACWSRLLLAIDLVGPLPDGDPLGAGRLRLPTTGTFDHDPDIHDVIQKLTQAA